MGAMDAIRDQFRSTYPIQLKVYTDLSMDYHFDKAKEKEEAAGRFYKLFNHKNQVSFVDISPGIIHHNGKIEYEVYMPSEKEMIPVDRRRIRIGGAVDLLKKGELDRVEAIRRDDSAMLVKAEGDIVTALAELDAFAHKPVFIDAIVPAGVRMGLAQQVRLEVDYFGKSWLEKYGNIVLTAIFVVGTVAIVWLTYGFVQDTIPKIAAQIPQVVNAYLEGAAKIPKV